MAPWLTLQKLCVRELSGSLPAWCDLPDEDPQNPVTRLRSLPAALTDDLTEAVTHNDQAADEQLQCFVGKLASPKLTTLYVNGKKQNGPKRLQRFYLKIFREGKMGEFIKKCPYLTALTITHPYANAYSRCVEDDMKWVSTAPCLKNLVTLDLSSTPVTNSNMTYIGKTCVNLEELRLNSTGITTVGIKNLIKQRKEGWTCTKLRVLSLKACHQLPLGKN